MATKLDRRPGLDPRRVLRLMTEAIDRCQLDLRGHTVLTEAATGAYVVTPVLAAMAGARVHAVVPGHADARARAIRDETLAMADLAGVASQINPIGSKIASIVNSSGIITNSGHVRPIDAETVSQMSPSSVVPLMYESWEYRPSDVDLEACRARGVAVAGTNERHPAVDVFSFLGPMAVRQLHDAGVSVYRSRVVLLCDNAFGPFIARALGDSGAEVTQATRLTEEVLDARCDAVILALKPGDHPTLTASEFKSLAIRAPGAVLLQYWGDTDRTALARYGVPVWPPEPPASGHMGILPSAVGPEPIIRLQAGGLKVGQLLAEGIENATPEDRDLVQLL